MAVTRFELALQMKEVSTG